MAAGRKNFIFFLCLLDGVQFSTTFRYYCLMRVYEWLGLTVTIHGSAITFAKLPTLKRVSCNIAKCSTPLRIGNAGLDIYSGYDAKQPKNVSGYSSPMFNHFHIISSAILSHFNCLVILGFIMEHFQRFLNHRYFCSSTKLTTVLHLLVIFSAFIS